MRTTMTLTDLLAPFGIAAPALEITGLTLVSNEVEPGGLFIAQRGSRRHGLEFVADALARGAAAVLAESSEASLLEAAHVECERRATPLLVAEPGLGQRVSEIAGRFYGKPSEALQVVGVTGTDGKTSVTQFIAQALHEAHAPCAVIGTLGQGVLGALEDTGHTTPDPVGVQRMLTRFRELDANTVAMEVSSHALDQGRVSGVRFAAAVLTNLTRDHLDYHGTLEAYAQAKASLFRAPIGCAVLNRDDSFGRRLEQELQPDLPVVTYAVGDRPDSADIVVTPCLRSDGMDLRLHWEGHVSDVALPLLGHFNAANVAAVIATLRGLGFSFDATLERVRRLRPVPGRMEPLLRPGAPLVVIDYAHTPAGLEAALQAARAHTQGRLWCVFGCGGDRDKGKRGPMGELAGRYADNVVITDDNPRSENPDDIIRDIVAGLGSRRATVRRDRSEAIQLAIEAAAPGDAVLIAGKGHEETQEIGGRQLPFSDRETALAVLSGVSVCSP